MLAAITVNYSQLQESLTPPVYKVPLQEELSQLMDMVSLSLSLFLSLSLHTID